MVQVETLKGINALDEILAVDGVDGVFIGPADLGADMGYPGQGDVDAVWQVVCAALRQIRAAGKAAGVLATLDGRIAQCREAGVNFLAVGADISLFANAMRGLAAKHKAV